MVWVIRWFCLACPFLVQSEPAFVLRVVVLSSAINVAPAAADESRPSARDATVVAAQANLWGDARRGALLFHKSAAACVKCHTGGKETTPLGPDLTTIAEGATDQYLVESILDPSKSIRKGFETVTVTTVMNGEVKSRLIAADTKERLVLRDATNLEQ